MKKKLKRIESVLGAKRPTVVLFEKVLNELSAKDQELLKKDVFLLAFSHWEELPSYFRQFLIRFFTHDREILLSFLLEKTPLGDLRFPLVKPELVLKLMYILEKNRTKGRISYLHLAFALLVSFRFPFKLRTLAEYLRRQQPVAGDILQLSGKIEITGDFD